MHLSVDRFVETRIEPNPTAYRIAACCGVLVLTASYVSVLYDVTTVVGGSRSLYAIVVAMVIAGTVLKRAIAPRTASILAAVVAVLGFGYYFTAANVTVESVALTIEILLWDAFALVTGTSLLRMVEAGSWTLGFAPGPVFLSWYLALRRRYALSTGIGGGALLFLVLTGDATVTITVVGTIGGLTAVGFGELERHGGSIQEVDALAVILGAIVVCSLLVPLASSGAFEGANDGGYGSTLEASLTTSTGESTIQGSISLSPEERFTVQSDTESYWRTNVYDRFTGDRWIRTGSERDMEGRLEEPPGETETVTQTVALEDGFRVLPTAPQPLDVGGEVDGDALVDEHGQIQPDEPLSEGDVYTVESAVINASPEELQNAGTDYPEEVTDRYLQRPRGASSTFDERTREIVENADADSPYEKARAIEAHLRTSKEYSLDVTRPNGNVAEEFLLEMDEGYCVYFATAMTQMLRSEGIPARYVSGYTSGERVGDEWVVRGLDAHAWVEVYFPGHGWVSFEPTPSNEREEIHSVDNADETGEDAPTDRNEAGESANESFPDPYYDSRYPYPLAAGQHTTDYDDRDDGTIDPYAENHADATREGNEGRWFAFAGVQIIGFGFAGLIVLAIGASWTNAVSRTVHGARLFVYACQLRLRSTGDVEDAYRRLEAVLENRYRARRSTESSRQYLSALSSTHQVDPRVHEVQRLYEQQKYGDRVDREELDCVIAAAESMVREALPIVGRLWR